MMRRPAVSSSLRRSWLAAGAILAALAAVGLGQETPPVSPEAAEAPAASPQGPVAAALEADGWTRLCRFRGRFVSGGLPREATRAIPLDSYDLRFLLKVRVDELLEGAVPEPWEDEIVFAVHSPSMYFRLRLGLRPGDGRHYPDEELLFGLWRKDGAFRLVAERLPGDPG